MSTMNAWGNCYLCGGPMSPGGCSYCQLMSTVRQAPPVQQYQQPVVYGGGYNGSGAGAATGDLVGKAVAGATAYIGYRAYRNYQDTTADFGESVFQGAKAARRWWVWFIWCFLWCVSFAMSLIAWRIMSSPGYVSYTKADSFTYARSMWLLVGVSPLCLGVPWCRCINVALFKRGRIYRFYAPLAKHLEWCPTWVLYLLIPLVMLLPA